MLADERLELATMRAAGVALRPVHAASVPREPPPRLGVEILAVTEVEQLALERQLGLSVRPDPADLTPEHHRRGHGITVAPRRRTGENLAPERYLQ